MVLRQIGAADGILQTLAPGLHGLDRQLDSRDVDEAARFFEERPIPAPRLQTPGSNEDAILDHYRPNADDAMRLQAGANP